MSRSEQVLKVTLYSLCAIAILTGLAGVLAGGYSMPGVGSLSPAVDSNFRFLSAVWTAFGLFCYWVAKHRDAWPVFIRPIAILMLAGALARVMSALVAGIPPVAEMAATLLEVLLFLLLWFSYRRYLLNG